MDLMYRQGASTRRTSGENRLAECWRDLHVISQAVTLAPEWYPIGDRSFVTHQPGLYPISN